MKPLILALSLLTLPAFAGDNVKHPRYGWDICAGLDKDVDCSAMMKMAQDIINNKSRYRCNSVDKLRPALWGGGLVVICNGPRDTFTVKQKGGIWDVTLDD